jgi:hypothetical protein
MDIWGFYWEGARLEFQPRHSLSSLKYLFPLVSSGKCQDYLKSGHGHSVPIQYLLNIPWFDTTNILYMNWSTNSVVKYTINKRTALMANQMYFHSCINLWNLLIILQCDQMYQESARNDIWNLSVWYKYSFYNSQFSPDYN